MMYSEPVKGVKTTGVSLDKEALVIVWADRGIRDTDGRSERLGKPCLRKAESWLRIIRLRKVPS